jgi:hypothetical protein
MNLGHVAILWWLFMLFAGVTGADTDRSYLFLSMTALVMGYALMFLHSRIERRETWKNKKHKSDFTSARRS